MSALKLNAYYYSFEATGNAEIDSVLEAVAKAGKSFHNTDDWSESFDWNNDGISVADNIQNVANKAAKALKIKELKND